MGIQPSVISFAGLSSNQTRNTIRNNEDLAQLNEIRKQRRCMDSGENKLHGTSFNPMALISFDIENGNVFFFFFEMKVDGKSIVCFLWQIPYQRGPRRWPLSIPG